MANLHQSEYDFLVLFKKISRSEKIQEFNKLACISLKIQWDFEIKIAMRVILCGFRLWCCYTIVQTRNIPTLLLVVKDYLPWAKPVSSQKVILDF